MSSILTRFTQETLLKSSDGVIERHWGCGFWQIGGVQAVVASSDSDCAAMLGPKTSWLRMAHPTAAWPLQCQPVTAESFEAMNGYPPAHHRARLALCGTIPSSMHPVAALRMIHARSQSSSCAATSASFLPEFRPFVEIYSAPLAEHTVQQLCYDSDLGDTSAPTEVPLKVYSLQK